MRPLKLRNNSERKGTPLSGILWRGQQLSDNVLFRISWTEHFFGNICISVRVQLLLPVGCSWSSFHRGADNKANDPKQEVNICHVWSFHFAKMPRFYFFIAARAFVLFVSRLDQKHHNMTSWTIEQNSSLPLLFTRLQAFAEWTSRRWAHHFTLNLANPKQRDSKRRQWSMDMLQVGHKRTKTQCSRASEK